MLHVLSSTPEVAVFFLIVCGAAAGALVAFFLLPSPRQMRRLQDEIDTLRAEHERYRSQVTSHFHKTAELVGVMTQSYKNVYDHLAQGAQALCDGLPALPSGFGESRLIADASFVVGDEGASDEASASRQERSTQAAGEPRRDDGGATPTDDARSSAKPESEAKEPVSAASTPADSADDAGRDPSVSTGASDRSASAAPTTATDEGDADALSGKRDWSRMEDTPSAPAGGGAGEALSEASPAKTRGNGADDSHGEPPLPATSH
jgi:uncharacterized membrane-anchored protein YhcB (DUF1043 family)